jgi:8-oxo-dGTP diphosphatase
MEKIRKYVCGFLFDGCGNVALIEKRRPEWQKGRLNGVGGQIEKGETPLKAMVREFREEAGDEISWRQFCLVKGDGYRVYYFTSKERAEISSKTDEKVGWYSIDKLPANVLPNLRWLIPMANYKFDITAAVIHQSPVC